MPLTKNGVRTAPSSASAPLMRPLISPSNSSASALSCAEATLAPGCRMREHYHLLAEELYYVLQGSGEIFVQGETRRIKSGDSVLIRPGQRHRIVNPPGSTQNLVFLAVSTPPHSVDDEYSTEI